MSLTGIVLMSLLNATTLSVDGEAINTPPQQAGLYDIQAEIDGQRSVRFSLSLPDGIDTAERPPLVVVLHYGGRPTRFYGRPLIEGLFEAAWRDLGAIFVAPESIDGQWNSAPNESFVMRLIESLASHYAVDRTKLVIAGYSMGAIGSWHFIRSYPDIFAAAVPVAGFPSGTLDCPVPVFTFAAPSDELFDINALQAQLDAARDGACKIEFRSVEARGHYDVGGFVGDVGLALPWLRQIFSATNVEGK